MIDGQDPDPRDDVFALSCIVYEFLTGRHPFGRAPASMARAGNFRPEAPANLSLRRWRALQAGLHLDRSKRTSTPKELLSGVADAASGNSGARRKFIGRAVIPGIVAVGVLLGITAYLTGGNEIGRISTEEQTLTRAQQKTAEEAARQQAQQKAAEQAAQQQSQQKAAEQAAQQQAQQKAAEQAAQQQAQQKAAEQAAQQQAQQKAAEVAAQQIGSPQIAEAQRLLTGLGLNAGAADGKVGPRTIEMVRAYQLAVGEPDTGTLTMGLLESMRRAAPPTMAMAKGLFSLAVEARRSGRIDDAIRLYDAALKFAPTDAEGRLALGDLLRGRSDYGRARHNYEIVLRAGGPTAAVARDRIASLPTQDVPTVADAASSPTTSQQTSREINTVNASIRAGIDGTYVGTARLTSPATALCLPSYPATIEVQQGRVSFEKYVTASVETDGTFSGSGLQHEGDGGLAVVSLSGQIFNDSIEADRLSVHCKYHLSLAKNGSR
jgi:tetratricopeptide (TPR) repeat protein